MIPTDKDRRKQVPVVRGLLDYFPLACLAVADLSRVGNEQHNPGQPMHWAREKSTDQVDCLVRHLMERGKFDTDKVRHMTKVAWRALAALQLEIEADGGAISQDDRRVAAWTPDVSPLVTIAKKALYTDPGPSVYTDPGLRRPQRMGMVCDPGPTPDFDVT